MTRDWDAFKARITCFPRKAQRELIEDIIETIRKIVDYLDEEGEDERNDTGEKQDPE